MCFDSKPDSSGKQTNIQEYIICVTHLAESLPTSPRFKWVMRCSIHKRFPRVGWNLPRSFCCSSLFCPEWCQVFPSLPPDSVSKADPCASPRGHYSQTWTAAHLGNTRAHVQARTNTHTHTQQNTRCLGCSLSNATWQEGLWFLRPRWGKKTPIIVHGWGRYYLSFKITTMLMLPI